MLDFHLNCLPHLPVSHVEVVTSHDWITFFEMSIRLDLIDSFTFVLMGCRIPSPSGNGESSHHSFESIETAEIISVKLYR